MSIILLSIGLNCFAEEHGRYKLVQEEIGRYQLIQGEYSFVNIKGQRSKINGLLKIDTVTGRVWTAEVYQYKNLKSGKI